MREGALRKKLQELGIPNWGSKDLMKRRHIEWLNIHNSNCDADESVRKTKRQLVRELEEWENTQGGRADIKESKVMRKDFDGSGYAKSHKTDFDGLIAQARMKRAIPEMNNRASNAESGDSAKHTLQPQPEVQIEIPDSPLGTEQQQPHSTLENGFVPQGLETIHGSQNGNHEDSLPPTNHAVANSTPVTEASTSAPHEEPPLGIQNPLGGTTRKVPMFAMPEEPVKEVDMSAT